jgi:1,4-dihydroxy-2-naphthoate octaprenyltransferase
VIYTIKLWLRAIRPFAYPASAVPVFVGVTAAWTEGYGFNSLTAFFTLLGVLAAHTGGNLMSDYFDFKKGVDREGKLGGSGVLVGGLLSPRAIFIGSLVSFAIAGVVAHFIMIYAGWKIIWLVLAGLFAGLFYSAPPFGFKYGALGELVIFFSFGVCVTLGAYVVQSGSYSWTPVFYSIPLGLLISAILNINNIRDTQTDLEAGVMTLAGVIGPDRSRFIYAGFIVASYASLVFFAIRGNIIPGAAIAVTTFPVATNLMMKVWRAPRGQGDSIAFLDVKTAQLSLIFGMSMIFGMVMWKVFFAS